MILYKPGAITTPLMNQGRRGAVLGVVYTQRPDEGGRVWLTSGYRSGDPLAHGQERAWDFDCAADLLYAEGLDWAARVQADLGCQFDVLWHRVKGRGGYHLHVEDESHKKRRRFTAGGLRRIRRLSS